MWKFSIKRAAKFFSVLLIIQISSCLFIGTDEIHRKICTEAPFYVDTSNIEHLGIYTKSWISPKNELIIKILLEPKFGTIDIVKDETEYSNNYRLNPERYALSYEINYFIPFVAIVKEENGTFNYGEEWEIWYVWAFVHWFEIRKKSRGQS